jgi:hypothetical protein
MGIMLNCKRTIILLGRIVGLEKMTCCLLLRKLANFEALLRYGPPTHISVCGGYLGHDCTILASIIHFQFFIQSEFILQSLSSSFIFYIFSATCLSYLDLLLNSQFSSYWIFSPNLHGGGNRRNYYEFV